MSAAQVRLYRTIRDTIAAMPDDDLEDTCRDLYMFEELGGLVNKADVLDALNNLIARTVAGHNGWWQEWKP